MRKIINSIVIAVFVVVALFLSTAFFIVDETQQVVITQFGEPMGKPIRDAGLYFKMPFIQTANYLDKRILKWDGDPNQIPTRDKRYIWVDSTARWKIVDPLKFMQTVATEAGAYDRLDDIVDSATRDAISNLILVETVRNSNRLVENMNLAQESDEDKIEIDSSVLEKITIGREKLTRDILKNATQIVPQYGIELIDVQIKRINYIKEVRKKVYDRMNSERKRAAEQFRSEGQGEKAQIEGKVAKELQEIRSEAYRKAQEIKGRADAEAVKIYAEAYNKDAEFYAFVKTLETYKNTIGEGTTLILSTDNDYYDYLKSIEGKKILP